MRVYFVRHGESETNAGDTYVGDNSRLTDAGIAQAKLVAKRCAKLPAEVVITSTMPRAQQTAEHILKELKKPVETSDLFRERRRPSEMKGMKKGSDEAVSTNKLMYETNWGKPGWHFSDEENFDDLKNRAKACLELLAGRKEEYILVVTHGYFMRIVLAYLFFGDEMTPTECQKIAQRTETENVGITVFDYDREKAKWSLWVWNDHAHLG